MQLHHDTFIAEESDIGERLDGMLPTLPWIFEGKIYLAIHAGLSYSRTRVQDITSHCPLQYMKCHIREFNIEEYE